jgi:hypothetical protein
LLLFALTAILLLFKAGAGRVERGHSVNTILSAITIWAAIGAQKAPGVEQVIKPKLTLTEEDESRRKGIDTWVLSEFVFIPPRMITIEVPGKGKRLLWYMVYRVTNRGEKARYFVPDFKLVTDKGASYQDAIIPKAQRAIQARENPLQPLENSVSIMGNIEPSDEGVDNSLYGVAVWDLDAKDHTLNGFDVFIGGLSNSFKRIEDPVSGETEVRRKTLQLKFARPGDEFNQHEREIRYLGEEWTYR